MLYHLNLIEMVFSWEQGLTPNQLCENTANSP